MSDYQLLAERFLRDLAQIPAPSHHEEARAAYCLNALHSMGFAQAYIDEANNVVCEWIGENAEETVIFAAHTDVVFGDTESLPFLEDEQNIYNPGCGDDTVSVALLMAAMKRCRDEGRRPRQSVVFVLNACEEGLGNLKGMRQIFSVYGDRVRAFFTFDGQYMHVVNQSVGSHRYRVTVKTIGGHSYNDFGNENAAKVLADGISAIYRIRLPEGDKTTYNVGSIAGGTSVNTIVQEASMLCEYRSESAENLRYMREQFQAIFAAMSAKAEVTVECVGERPCMENVDPVAQQRLTDLCVAVQQKHTGLPVTVTSGSTDCNIPHSMGIPAVCAGNYRGGGAHTREEWLEKSSLPVGLAIVCELVGAYFD